MPLFSQGKFEISGGFGFPDMQNLKIRYGNNMQIGASCGFFGGDSFSAPSIIAIEIYLHFAGKSEIIKQRPWYLLVALYYVREDSGFMDPYFLLTRFGRTFNFSKRMGLNLDVGAFYPRDCGYPRMPSGSISFFVRL
jgi:hypothetical protein